MRAFIVYCHPSDNSFTKSMCDAFIKGVVDSGNEYVISDLYKMGFQTDMTEEEYLRDANYRTVPDVPNRWNSSSLITCREKMRFERKTGTRTFKRLMKREKDYLTEKQGHAWYGVALLR